MEMEANKRIFFNRWFFGIIALGVLGLVASFLAQHVFDLTSCMMCKIQRAPFFLLIVNAMFGITGYSKEEFFRVVQFCLALGVLLGVVHFGIQMKMVPDFCSVRRGVESSRDFLELLQGSRCSEVSWAIWGVPVSIMCALLHGAFLWGSVHLTKRKFFGGDF